VIGIEANVRIAYRTPFSDVLADQGPWPWRSVKFMATAVCSAANSRASSADASRKLKRIARDKCCSNGQGLVPGSMSKTWPKKMMDEFP